MDNGYLSNFQKKVLISLLIVFFLVISQIFKERIPYLDEKGDEYFVEATQKTVAIYTVVRITNSLVSVAKETEIDITPAGVGLTVHIGEILDPIDDATERLSSILTLSLAILGLMKIFKEILTVYSFNIISYLLIILLPIIWINKLKNLAISVVGVIALILAVRLALPVCGLINSFLYNDFFKPEIEKNLKVFKDLSYYETKISKKNVLNIEEKERKGEGFFSKFESIKSGLSTIKEKTEFAKEITIYLWNNKDKLISAIINFIILEVSLIVIQTLILPITVVWIIIKLINSFFDKRENLEEIAQILINLNKKE